MVSFPFFNHSIPPETSVYENGIRLYSEDCAFRGARSFSQIVSSSQNDFVPRNDIRNIPPHPLRWLYLLPRIVTIPLMFPWYMRVSVGSGINENCQRESANPALSFSRHTGCIIKDFHSIVNLLSYLCNHTVITRRLSTNFAY